MSLLLFETDFKVLDGYGPKEILLQQSKTMIGRGSQTMSVDAAIVARRNGNHYHC
jgi:hypothetical protein